MAQPFDVRAELERMAREGLAHARAGTLPQAEALMELDLPGSLVAESFTVQLTLSEEEPDVELRDEASKIATMAEQVVRDEDLAELFANGG